MPQELALFSEFTIEETLNYFGRLYHMKSDDIRKRTDFIIELLNLPNKNKKIANLSGGQQRRVSIAAAILHSPPLLILDEPTVGVDPLLRCRIWEYLEKVCINDGKSEYDVRLSYKCNLLFIFRHNYCDNDSLYRRGARGVNGWNYEIRQTISAGKSRLTAGKTQL